MPEVQDRGHRANAGTNPSGEAWVSPAGRTLRLDVDDPDLLLRLSGPAGSLLHEVGLQSGASVGQRGHSIFVSGEPHAAEVAYRFLEGAGELLREGYDVRVSDVAHSIRALAQDPARSLTELLDQVILITPRKKPILAKTAGQRDYIAKIKSHDLTFGIGPAGTGKTYLAMAMAAAALASKRVKRIVLTRPAVEAGERLGFLPGDLAEKINPYLRPLYDALNDMLDFEKVQQLRTRGEIEVAPLAFMRGRTLNDSFVILDEAQNATTEQMKMFLTRLGYGSKAVVTGDVTQTDLPRGALSGLAQARRILSGVQGVAFTEFSDVDVVRHPLVQRIVLAYGRFDAEEEARRRELQSAAAESSPLASPTPEPSSTVEPAGLAESDPGTGVEHQIR
jgi:phosphate starvation-inducible protein PhoH and related proteins